MNIKPDFANVKMPNGTIAKKNPEDVQINDEIIIKPGEKIPLDGIVIEGKSMIDTSSLTGESNPVSVAKNDAVLSGSINMQGIITVKVTKKYAESTVSKILELVENAVDKKASTEKFITKFSKIYTPIVIILAICILAFGTLTKTNTLYEWIYRALTFLVISCPCALVISVPLSFFGGIGCASKHGILIKGSSYMDSLARVDTIAFDKTGTLTKGKFEVQEIIPEDISKEQLIEYVALAEHFSNHPIATSIKKLYNKKVDINRISDLEEIPGKGIKCAIDNKKVVIGNIVLLKETLEEETKVKNKEANNEETEINEEEYGTVIYIAVENEYVGKIIISDEIKSDTKAAIEELKKIGIHKIIMLTGDKKEEATRVGKELGINEIYAELLPADKINETKKLIKNNSENKIAFVGDGVNDSPVLTTVDVGIAMGGLGSDAAMEAADVVIMTDELSKIPKAIEISKRTIKIAKQNIAFAILIKILILVLSAMGMAEMWLAVFADVGVTLIAVLNSLRAMKI